MAQTGLFTRLHTVDSTNNYAMGMVHAGMARHGMTWFAEEQTNGKGQRGKSWKSPPGESILMSIVLDPAGIPPHHPFRLLGTIALICRQFLEETTGHIFRVKWPNDLYWRDRKAGGILIENVWHGRDWKFCVIGVGINVNQEQFDPALQNPVSLRQVTGKTYDPAELAMVLSRRIVQGFNSLPAIDVPGFVDAYNQALYKQGEEVTLKLEGNRVHATIRRVDEDGKLVIEGPAAGRYAFGEVEWVLDDAS